VARPRSSRSVLICMKFRFLPPDFSFISVLGPVSSTFSSAAGIVLSLGLPLGRRPDFHLAHAWIPFSSPFTSVPVLIFVPLQSTLAAPDVCCPRSATAITLSPGSVFSSPIHFSGSPSVLNPEGCSDLVLQFCSW
jgi:hypothetical protein